MDQPQDNLDLTLNQNHLDRAQVEKYALPQMQIVHGSNAIEWESKPASNPHTTNNDIYVFNYQYELTITICCC